MLVLVTYDVTDDRRRRRVAKLLEGYGRRVQRSVFECNLTKAQFQKLRQRLEHLRAGSREAGPENRQNQQRADAAAQETFSIRCYRLCASCTQRIALLGPGAVTTDEPFYIVA